MYPDDSPLLKLKQFLRNHIYLIILLLLVVISLATLFFIKREQKRSISNIQINTPPTPPKEQMKGTSLTFSPQNVTVRAQEPFTLKVLADNQGNEVSGTDLKIIFDPDMLFINSATVGEFFTNPIVFDNSVDNKRGLISLSLGSTTPATQSAKLVTINGVFRMGVSGETDLIILPESKMTRVGSTNSILEQTGQATLSIILL